ncbi:MAG: FhaA domain-containing protein [Kineosporiaceae bacterium]
MGIFDRFEKGVERAVRAPFTKAFRSEVQPVEIAAALRRELDENVAVLARGRTIVPNHFTVVLSPDDYDRFAEWAQTLADELAEAVLVHAERQRYEFVGPVQVTLLAEDRIEAGDIEVESQTVRGALTPAADPGGEPGRPVVEVEGHQYVLAHPVTVLGRDETCDIVLPDSGVSRRHAELVVDSAGDQNRLAVRDLGSTNGTFVDGARVTHQVLAPGNVVTVGRSRIAVRELG